MLRVRKSVLPIVTLAVVAAGFRLMGQPSVADLFAIGYLIAATMFAGRPLPVILQGSAVRSR